MLVSLTFSLAATLEMFPDEGAEVGEEEQEEEGERNGAAEEEEEEGGGGERNGEERVEEEGEGEGEGEESDQPAAASNRSNSSGPQAGSVTESDLSESSDVQYMYFSEACTHVLLQHKF